MGNLRDEEKRVGLGEGVREEHSRREKYGHSGSREGPGSSEGLDQERCD